MKKNCLSVCAVIAGLMALTACTGKEVTPIATLNGVSNIRVSVDYDKSAPDVTIISPSNKEYSVSEGSITSGTWDTSSKDENLIHINEGTGTITYFIQNAEPGTWSVRTESDDSDIRYSASEVSLVQAANTDTPYQAEGNTHDHND